MENVDINTPLRNIRVFIPRNPAQENDEMKDEKILGNHGEKPLDEEFDDSRDTIHDVQSESSCKVPVDMSEPNGISVNSSDNISSTQEKHCAYDEGLGKMDESYRARRSQSLESDGQLKIEDIFSTPLRTKRSTEGNMELMENLIKTVEETCGRNEFEDARGSFEEIVNTPHAAEKKEWIDQYKVKIYKPLIKKYIEESWELSDYHEAQPLLFDARKFLHELEKLKQDVAKDFKIVLCKEEGDYNTNEGNASLNKLKKYNRNKEQNQARKQRLIREAETHYAEAMKLYKDGKNYDRRFQQSIENLERKQRELETEKTVEITNESS